jgi:hypothetical protein
MDFSPQSYAPDGTAIFGNDAQLMVKFFIHPELSVYQSKDKGVPVYNDVEMIEVFQPGEKESVKQLVTDFHKLRFPKQYENFKAGKDQIGSGTPLDLLFPSEPGMVLTLKSFNIFTIQQLAALNDTAISALPMGGRQLVERAKVYLTTAKTGADLHQMEAMQKQIAELQAALTAKNETTDETPQRRGPGRPPKET